METSDRGVVLTVRTLECDSNDLAFKDASGEVSSAVAALERWFVDVGSAHEHERVGEIRVSGVAEHCRSVILGEHELLVVVESDAAIYLVGFAGSYGHAFGDRARRERGACGWNKPHRRTVPDSVDPAILLELLESVESG